MLISNGTEDFPSLPTSTVGERDTGDAQDDWGDAHVDWGVDAHHGSVMKGGCCIIGGMSVQIVIAKMPTVISCKSSGRARVPKYEATWNRHSIINLHYIFTVIDMSSIFSQA